MEYQGLGLPMPWEKGDAGLTASVNEAPLIEVLAYPVCYMHSKEHRMEERRQEITTGTGIKRFNIVVIVHRNEVSAFV